MKRIATVTCVLLAAAVATDATAAPKKSTTGVNCSETGTARKDGKDQSTGETVNCLWDTCTYCAGPKGELDCSIKKTEYSNPRDCKAKSQTSGTRRPETLDPGVFDPGTAPPRRPMFQSAPQGGVMSR